MISGWLYAHITAQLPTVSWILLCLIEGNPPLEQERACSVEKCVRQAQLVSALDGSQPYLRVRASLKGPLCGVKPNSSRGSKERQLNTLFSWAKSMARCNVLVWLGLTAAAEHFNLSSLCFWISCWLLYGHQSIPGVLAAASL